MEAELRFRHSDNTGNIKAQTVASPAGAFAQSFTYDALGRLKTAQETSGGNQTWTQTFTYDRYGNRTGLNQTVNGQMTNNTPTIDANTNRFALGQGYTYDLAGNVIVDAQGRQFTFNGDNKQTEVRDASNNVIGTYFYDGDGKRIKKVTNQESTTFVYSGGKLVAEYSNSTSTTSNPTTQYLGTDMLGSPRVISDQNGNVVSRRDFLPFGEELTRANYGTDTIRQKFTGYQRDAETNLDFAEARYYNSQNGRFTAVDPLLASGKSANPQTFNRYAYTMNNPLRLTDKSGMQAGADENEVIAADPTVWIKSLGKYLDQINSYINYTRGYEPIQGESRFSQSQPTGQALGAFNEEMQKVDSAAQYEPTGIYNALKSANELDRGQGSYGKFAFHTGMMFANIATLPTGGGAKKEGLKFLGKESLELGAEKKGFDLALGLGDNLFDFANKTNSTTYFERYGKTFVPEWFEGMAKESNQINFNLRNFSFGKHIDWLKAGKPEIPGKATSYELNHILSNEELRNKTRFFVYPLIK